MSRPPIRIERGYPPDSHTMRVNVWEFWRDVYLGATLQTGLDIAMEKAIREVNVWLERVGP